MIPKFIHQTAKTAEIPPKWQAYQATVRSLHPDWTYRLWTDDDNFAFVKSEVPEFFDVFTRLPKNIMRADTIRYVLMYKLGGLYLDLDYEMLKPFDLTQHDCVLPLETDVDSGPEARIGNAFFASAPGHPFFRAALDDLIANPPLSDDVNVLSATGPLFLSRILCGLPREQLGIVTPARPLFSPYTPRNTREYRAILRDGLAYGIHHCHGTWREYGFRERVRNGLSRVVRRFI